MKIITDIINHLFLATSGNVSPDLGGLNFFAVLIILVGLVSVIYPHLFWHLRIGRKVPHVKPSNLYLNLLRFGGILVVALGIYVIFYISQNF
jgi:hypothetical protein